MLLQLQLAERLMTGCCLRLAWVRPPSLPPPSPDPQAAYDEAQEELWGAMDVMEGRLAASRFLHGDRWGGGMAATAR